MCFYSYLSFSSEEVTQAALQRLERQVKRGLMTQLELNLRLGRPEALKVEAWREFFNHTSTKRITAEEFEAMYFRDSSDLNWEWWRWIKDEVMQEGDELWYWNTIKGFMGSMGIVLFRREKVIYLTTLGKA